MNESMTTSRFSGSVDEPCVPNNAKQVMSATRSESSWAVIRIDRQMRGKIAIDAAGQRFLEAELNQPRWTQANACATSLVRTVERVFSLEENALQLRMRIVALGDQQVQPEVHLIAPGLECPDTAMLRSVIARFGAGLVAQRNLLDATGPETLSPECEQHIDEGVHVFLQGHGGQPVQREMQILVEDESLASVKGHWRQRESEEKQAPQELVLEAMYDGRRLRSRTLYVAVVGERTRGMEIFYDEEQFDHALRELADDKHAMLSLAVAETKCGKDRSRFELRSLQRIPTPEHLQLTGPASSAG